MPAPATFIVRTKDKADTIERALRSIRDQTLDAEIVVVDSGSVDGTLEIAAHWADHVVRLPPEQFTYGRALNVGAARAAAPVHVALSAHCFLPCDDWLKRCVGHLVREDVAAVNGRLPAPDDPAPTATIFQDYAQAVRNPWWGLSNHAAAWRADVWRRFPFDERLAYAEDKEWALRVLAAGWVIAFDPALFVDMSHQWRGGWREFASRHRRNGEAVATFAPQARYGLEELVAEWWAGDVDHRPAWRRRGSPKRIAALVSKYRGFRAGAHQRRTAARAVPRT